MVSIDVNTNSTIFAICSMLFGFDKCTYSHIDQCTLSYFGRCFKITMKLPRKEVYARVQVRRCMCMWYLIEEKSKYARNFVALSLSIHWSELQMYVVSKWNIISNHPLCYYIIYWSHLYPNENISYKQFLMFYADELIKYAIYFWFIEIFQFDYILESAVGRQFFSHTGFPINFLMYIYIYIYIG